MLPGYYYYFHVGVKYSYKGHQGVAWSEEFVTGEPLEAEVWWQSEEQGRPFQKYGDLQSWEEYIDGLNNPLAEPLPRHDQGEIEKAIEVQEEAVQKSSYPYTPPEQLDTPEEG
jgi:hypothetical protein